MAKTAPAITALDLDDLTAVLRMLGDRADTTPTAPGTPVPDPAELLKHTASFQTLMRHCADNAARHAKIAPETDAAAPAMADAYLGAQVHAATAHRHLALALELSLRALRGDPATDPAAVAATAYQQRTYGALTALSQAHEAAWFGAKQLETAARQLPKPVPSRSAAGTQAAAVTAQPAQAEPAAAGRGRR
ncbi:hypothetical protein P3T36_003357 [Kitasatospora sp. MAP12-15]|uniref:hypothetical protein n=1 Tax=unclassified Kitasatospora TaxID=2633591 RepID=UPI002474BA05|nr:hypothetical protein [Kitasatospora sp. MAP12-44]MDH6111335.1 hypothetical protein [Kitasatospora sp. MAP12-44]